MTTDRRCPMCGKPVPEREALVYEGRHEDCVIPSVNSPVTTTKKPRALSQLGQNARGERVDKSSRKD